MWKFSLWSVLTEDMVCKREKRKQKNNVKLWIQRQPDTSTIWPRCCRALTGRAPSLRGLVTVLRAVPQFTEHPLPALIREDGRGVTAVPPAQRMREENLSDLEGEQLNSLPLISGPTG